MSAPFSSRWVAKEWRRLWHEAGFASPAARTARFTAFCTEDSERWCRRRAPERGSREGFAAGNTYCHPHSRAAFGYFLARAPGR